MAEVRLKISPPWVTYINKVQAMFDPDPQIACNAVWGGANPSITLATNNPEKAAALLKLLPEEVSFGNVKLSINVDCNTISNQAFASAKELFETAFEKNPVFEYAVVPPSSSWFVPFTYVVFKKEVVQFFNDNLNDCHGIVSTLYQDIAEEIFPTTSNITGGNIYYCTAVDMEGKFGTPLGEWP